MAGKGRVGVLALQGAFEAHREVFRRLGFVTDLVRTAEEIRAVDALVLPGGESSAMLRLMEGQNLLEVIGESIVAGLPVFATCAGVILLATEVSPHQKSLAAMDIDVERNAYGRQIHSSVETLRMSPVCGDTVPHEGVFIRAPKITRVGTGAEILAWRGEDPVLVRSPGILAATFHPELGRETFVHERFLEETCRWAR